MVDINDLLTPRDEDKDCSGPYREIIGSILYCANTCRLDIAFAVNVLAPFCQAPKQKHWEAAKRILRYLKGTQDLGIVIKSASSFVLDCFSDADWAGDTSTRKSTSGTLICLNDTPIIFKSQRQNLIALSTTEAEYVAAGQTIKELLWVRSLLQELKLEPLNINLWVDNQSAIRLIKNPEFHPRTKHMDIKLHFIRDHYKKKEFEVEYIPTASQKADILTKPRPRKYTKI